MSEKQFLTVNEVAKLYGKAVQTIYRHVASGKLSRQDNGLIAFSECLRVYGAIPAQSDKVKSEINENVKNAIPANLDVIALLQDKINSLEGAVTELKEENKTIKKEALEREQQAIEREKRLMALLEHQAGIAESKPAGFFGGLFGGKK
jgi:predicted transcriptional regulator